MPVSEFRARLARRPVAVSAAGLVGALAVHALLVLAFVLDLSLPARRPLPRGGVGASDQVSTEPAEMTVVFINGSSPESTPPAKPKAPASLGVRSPDLSAVILSPDASPSPIVTDVHSPQSSDVQQPSGDPAERARLYGRYLTQVQARIERAWMRPRDEIGAPRFSCRARIRQDRRGTLLDVTLDQCNGTARWRESLLSAIRTASPLPAPPDASVYADVLWMSFASEAFQKEGPTQGFDPETSTTRLADEQQFARRSFENFASRQRQSAHERDSNVVHLTIIGDPGATPQPDEPATRAPAPPLPESQRSDRPL